MRRKLSRGSRTTTRRFNSPRNRGNLSIEHLEPRRLLSVNVLTYHNDIASTGVNANETILTPATVGASSFGKLFTTPLDGQVYAQPLVDTGVTVASGPNTAAGAAGLHDIVLAATQHDSLYAIDAAPASGGVILWKRSFIDITSPGYSGSTPGSNINSTLGATAITTVPATDVGTDDITPEIGITGTPVIDSGANTLYVVVKTKETISGASHYVQRLHAINLSDGTDRAAPFLIGDTTNGNANNTPIYVYGDGDGSVVDPYNQTGRSVVQFNAFRENQRAALSLVNNVLYVAWASHGDNGPYHGWVVGWDVSKVTTSGMTLNGVFNTSPNGGLGGIWLGGGRLTFEPDGSDFYFETGNGPGFVQGNPPLDANGFPANGNYYEALVKVVADPTTTPTSQGINGWGFKVADYFIPFNQGALNASDTDFGSSGPVLLPASAGIPGHAHLMLAAGKEGRIYVLDRDNLGKFDPANDHVLNAVSDGNGHNTPAVLVPNGICNTPAYFNGVIYELGRNSSAMTFTIATGGTLAPGPTTDATFGYLPGAPTVSANGTASGIVWLADRTNNEIRAYDAANLSNELWNSSQNGNDPGTLVKFAVPTVANGEVFVGTANGLSVYGIAPLDISRIVVAEAVPHNGILESNEQAVITWALSGLTPVSSMSLTVDGGPITTIFGPYPHGNESYYAGVFGPLGAGSHSYTIEAPGARNVTPKASGSFDVTATNGLSISRVVLSEASPQNGILESNQQGIVTCAVVGADPISVSFTVDGKRVAATYGPYAGSGGQSLFAGVFAPLVAGAHRYSILATDAQGQTGTVNATFVVAAAPPTVSQVIVLVQQNTGLLDTGNVLTWTVTDGYALTHKSLNIDGTAATAIYGPYPEQNGGTNYAGVFGLLAAGDHSYTISVADSAGRSATITGTLTIALAALRPAALAAA